MMKFSCLILIIILSHLCFGKDCVSIVVYNQQTNEQVYVEEINQRTITPPKVFWGESRYTQQVLKANKDGSFKVVLPQSSDDYMSLFVRHKDYYPATLQISHESVSKNNESIAIYLKPKVNPLPLITREIPIHDTLLSYTSEGNTRSFDCLKADWLPPYGEGEQADIVFSLTKCNIDSTPYALFSLHFTNPNDGIMLINEPYHQQRMFIREVPQEVHFVQTLTFREKLDVKGYVDSFPKRQCYVFRVRTALTSSGEVETAFYGKLYDAFQFDWNKNKGWNFGFEYYLNPKPNDRNLEYNGCTLENSKEPIRHVK